MSAPAIQTPGSVQREANEAAKSEQNLDKSRLQDIANLAYALWQLRGCPEGSAETDWYQAEQQLRR